VKKIDFSGETKLKPKDFLSVFQNINTNNFLAADTNFIKLADTTRIAWKAMTQFVPDTVLTKFIEKDKNPVFYPVGKIIKEKETYLLMNVSLKHKKKLIVVVVDSKNNRCLAAKMLIDNSVQDDYVHSLSINKEPTFLLSQEKMAKII